MSAAEIASANRSFEDAVHRSNLDTIADLYETDAVVLPPDGPTIKGRDAIRQFWQSAIEEHGLKDMRLESVELEINGQIANEIGNGTLSMITVGGETETVEIKFLVVWKRSGGVWRLHRDIWNSGSA
jgi:uncharacterized protein (TIGR02246 family)